jgi:hypothetical protein
VSDDLSDFDPWVVLLPEDDLDEDEDQDVDESRSWEPGEWSSRTRHPAAAGLKLRPAVGTSMVAVVAWLAGCWGPRRGGNRLPAGHPARGRTHRYERCRELPPDPERRDKHQRERTRIAANDALARGELDLCEYTALMALLDLTDKTCKVTYHQLETIGSEAGGYSRRTVCTWLARLRQRGWVQRAHRFTVGDGGQMVGTSNLWRIDIPAHLRAERYAAEQKRRGDAAARRAGPGRYTPPARANGRGGSAKEPPDYWANEAQRLAQEQADPVQPAPMPTGIRQEHKRLLSKARRARKRAPP